MHRHGCQRIGQPSLRAEHRLKEMEACSQCLQPSLLPARGPVWIFSNRLCWQPSLSPAKFHFVEWSKIADFIPPDIPAVLIPSHRAAPRWSASFGLGDGPGLVAAYQLAGLFWPGQQQEGKERSVDSGMQKLNTKKIMLHMHMIKLIPRKVSYRGSENATNFSLRNLRGEKEVHNLEDKYLHCRMLPALSYHCLQLRLPAPSMPTVTFCINGWHLPASPLMLAGCSTKRNPAWNCHTKK